MSFEKSKFGWAGGATTASSPTVSNHFGQREVGKGVGITNTSGFMNELVMDIDGEVVNAGEFPLIAPTIPAGSRIEDAFLEVTEVFVLGGTAPVIEVGTDGTEATNGVSITEAQAEAVGVYDVTAGLAGTWAGTVGLAAATSVGVAMSGTSPTSTSAGKARLVIRYVKM